MNLIDLYSFQNAYMRYIYKNTILLFLLLITLNTVFYMVKSINLMNRRYQTIYIFQIYRQFN